MTDMVPAVGFYGDLTFLGSVRPARVDWGRWIADCSRPYCRNAWQLTYDMTEWTCNLCGAVTSVMWPADPGAVEYLLMMRPDPATRNWHPGEQLEQLMIENVQHDVAPDWLMNATDPIHDVMTVVDGRVVSGALLPGIQHRRTLVEAGRPFAIETGD